MPRLNVNQRRGALGELDAGDTVRDVAAYFIRDPRTISRMVGIFLPLDRQTALTTVHEAADRG